MLQDVPTIPHADVFRHSVPIRVASYYVLLFGCAVFSALGIYPLPVATIGGAVLVETVVLVACYRRARASPRWAATYLAIEGLCQAAIFHLSGSVRMAFAAPVYIFALLNPGLQLDRRGHFLVANGFVALFAGVVAAEHTGLLASTPRAELVVSEPLGVASVLIMLLCLNVAAFFIAAVREQLEENAVALAFATRTLRMHSDELELRVRQRTTELEASYRALQGQASEHRTFVYTVTHDLKAPLNAILLRADHIREREGTRLAPDSDADLGRITSLAERGESMLRDLMAHFEVSESPEPSDEVPLAATVRRAIEPLESEVARKGLRVQIADLPVVWGQPKKLTHVFANLLSNAVKFTPATGGHITVGCQVDDGSVVVCVADNGPGIPPGYERSIFNLFARVPRGESDAVAPAGAEGTGVGLAIVRRIVEQHHGEVWVESPPGAGSRFYVRFPRRSE